MPPLIPHALFCTTLIPMELSLAIEFYHPFLIVKSFLAMRSNPILLKTFL